MTLRVSLVIATHNIDTPRVRNLLESIQCQTIHSEIETVIVDYASTEDNQTQLQETVNPFNANIYIVNHKEWSPPRANNIGLRKESAKTIIKIDADTILEPRAVEDTLNHMKTRKTFIIKQPLFLPRQLDLSTLQFPRDYKRIAGEKLHYQLPSYGGFFAAHRQWWHRVRGYDERYLLYGCNDWDLWNRAIRSGMNRIIFGKPGNKGMRGITAYTNNSRIYHQWHPKPWIRLNIAKETFEKHKKKNRQIYNASTDVIRNNADWGTVK